METVCRNAVGFFGGAFSPVHSVHVQIVKTLLATATVSTVVVVPASDTYAKAGLLCSRDRILLLNLAFKDIDRVIISDIDTCRDEFANPLDTARELTRRYLNTETEELVWIMGADRLDRIAHNGRLSAYASEYRLLVVDRPPLRKNELLTLESVRDWSERITFFEFPFADSSATIRDTQVFREFSQIMGFTWKYTSQCSET